MALCVHVLCMCASVSCVYVCVCVCVRVCSRMSVYAFVCACARCVVFGVLSGSEIKGKKQVATLATNS